MIEEWITKDHDMTIAEGILAKHYEEPEEEVGVQEVTVIQEGSVLIERADWVIELEETMEAKYGEELGLDVAARVITTLMISDETIH